MAVFYRLIAGLLGLVRLDCDELVFCDLVDYSFSKTGGGSQIILLPRNKLNRKENIKSCLQRIMDIKKYHHHRVNCHHNNQPGFTLIEVLVSMVILSIGLLGIFAMQSRALMDNQDAYLRTQAVFLAYDMSDRIRANGKYWKTANLATTLTNAQNFTQTNHPFCSAYDPTTAALASPLADPDKCSDQQMAEYDTYRWLNDVAAVLPSGTVALAYVADPNTASTDNEIIQLTISWQRVNQNMNNKLGSNASYSLDVRL